jgi:uroporphyrinogen-III decarboxylase
MPKNLTSRERMLRAIRHQEPDRVPCAFMSFTAMRGRCQDAYEVVQEELSLGLDSMLFIPSSWRGQRINHPDLRGLPVRLPATVKTHLWLEHLPGEQFPVLHKEYHTPAGTLTALVRKTPDWPHGNFIPLMEDYQVPRAIKPLISTPQDVDILRTILQPPSAEDIAVYHAEVQEAKAFSAHNGCLVVGGWGVGVDMLGWLCGLQNMMLLTADEPDMVEDLLGLISSWNQARMRAILQPGPRGMPPVDLFIRRGWYESADFWSPRLFRRFLLPILRREVELAHEYGIPFAYIMTTGTLPLLDLILEAGVDVLMGVDPLQRADGDALAVMRDRLGGKVCLWGGINGAITVEDGGEEDVRAAVGHALQVMRGVNGFVLSPVDNITEITPKAWRNIDVLIKAWRSFER